MSRSSIGRSTIPAPDSIVRVEAGRLRSRLDEHYAHAGAAREIRIEPSAAATSPEATAAARPERRAPSFEQSLGGKPESFTSRGQRPGHAALSLWAWRSRPRFLRSRCSRFRNIRTIPSCWRRRQAH